MPLDPVFYSTGETTDAEQSASVLFRDVPWLRRAIVAALLQITRSEYWQVTNEAQRALVEDYANEVFESLTFDPAPPPAEYFEIGAVTTAQAQTVTITGLRTTAGAYTISWGDNWTDSYPAGYTGSPSHQYTAAGVYEIIINTPPAAVTWLVLTDAKLIVGVGTIAMLTALQVLQIDGTPYAFVAAGELTNADSLSYLYINNAANVGRFTTLQSKHALSFVRYTNAMTTNQVVSMLYDLYGQSHTKTPAGGTINLAGTNAAAGGTYQSACPPTTGQEYRYQLINGTCGTFMDASKRWATVLVN